MSTCKRIIAGFSRLKKCIAKHKSWIYITDNFTYNIINFYCFIRLATHWSVSFLIDQHFLMNWVDDTWFMNESASEQINFIPFLYSNLCI